MNNLGIDVGNYSTKTSTGIIFRSKVRPGIQEDFAKKDVYSVKFDGESYIVGDVDGSTLLAVDKYMYKSYKIMLYTAIANSFPNEEEIHVNICVGIPVSYYKQYANLFNKAISEFGCNEITVNGRHHIIFIDNVISFPQSAIVLGENSYNYPAIVIDIGGGTVDISEWDNNDIDGIYLVKRYSYTIGFESVMENFVDIVSSDVEIRADKNEYTATSFIKSDTLKTITGKHNISQLKDSLLSSYVSKIYNKMITDKFGVGSAESIILTGGPSELLSIYFNKYFDINCIYSKVPQLDNAITFSQILEEKFPTPEKSE